MAHIPEGAKWYIAEVVEEFTIEGEPGNLVHLNLVLVRADSPEEAYSRAIALGWEGETRWLNSDHKTVSARFCGLKDLNVIHGELENGTELIYEGREDVSPAELAKLAKPKEKLGIFMSIEQCET